ncbi:MAG: carboxyvinyl-carboxyphosphonate phosphorylmutase [Nitrospiraceae bacterium]|nr:MAG: carboxyvinyl-carboxyphosphonate phosphorylmutase [Nitrospiraceae bacterium]
MIQSYGELFRNEINKETVTPIIGVYDVFSATVAAKYYNALFISGFSFAASYYGLPDIGFIAWSDMTAFVQRIRTVLPNHHLLVDIDDGYADSEVACHVVSLLEAIGASGIVIEDQKRPRRCGHYDGKEILELEQFLVKLNKVLYARRDLVVIARTDVHDEKEALERARAFSDAGADAVLVDAVNNVGMIKRLRDKVNKPVVYNQLAGGKSPWYDLATLAENGASIVLYSTPCLFAAQAGVEDAIRSIKEKDFVLDNIRSADLGSCTRLLNSNLDRRKKK